ncbi:MAG TPA: hypothetical protein VI389_05065 [Geobacteraceae bacterium]
MTSQKVSLKISAVASAFVKAEATKETKLSAVHGDVSLSPCDRATVLVILSQDSEREVKEAAIRGLRELPESAALEIASTQGVHPRILDILARLHYTKPAIVTLLVAHPDIEPQTLAFLEDKAGVKAEKIESQPEPHSPQAAEPIEPHEAAEDEASTEESGEIDEESDEFKSKYQLAQSMGVADKIKMALTGDKEWRTLLLKDSNKLVNGSVVKNPRITEAEVLGITKSVVQNEEILRIICMNKEWIKNYNIRKALALNNKTPLPSALRFLSTLTEKDLASIAKSKNISSVISTQARRLLLNKVKK